jgi:hypothetical protein
MISGKDGKMLKFWTVTMVEAYREARLEEIPRQYSVRLVRSRRHRLYQHVLLRIGGLLVRAGHGLQARYPRAAGAGGEACHPVVGEGRA